MAVLIQCSADAHSFVKLRIYDQKRDMYIRRIHFCMKYIEYTLKYVIVSQSNVNQISYTAKIRINGTVTT